MIPDKAKRALRRMRQRTASSRRKRVAVLRSNTERSGTFSAPRSIAGTLRHGDEAARCDGSRLPTRQELRVEAELQYATHELGLP